MAINLNIVSKFDQKGLKKAQDSLRKFASGAVKAAGAAVAGVGVIGVQSVRSFASFDAAMTKSIAIMGDVSDTMRNDMSEAAREVAKQTTFSADQAAESFFFLASAGLDAEQSIAAMPQVAKFAQAGMFDMALATDLATDAQSALGLTSDDAAENLENLTRVTDVFVKANNLANTSVQQISEALTNKAGAALKVAGKDLEEGAAVLAVFADQGVKGTEAGEKLNIALRDITRAAGRAPEKFEALGLEVLDADDNLRNMADVVDEFTEVLGPMSDATAAVTLEQLGLTRGVGDAIKLLLGGGDSIREYEAALRDAGGTTEQVANNQLETLSAKADLLRSRIADLGIAIGTSLAPLADDMIAQLGPTIDSLEAPLIKMFEELAPKIAELIAQLPALIEGLIPLIEPVGEITALFTGLLEDTLPLLKKLIEDFGPVLETFTGFLADNGTVVGALILSMVLFTSVLRIVNTTLGIFTGVTAGSTAASGGFAAMLKRPVIANLITLGIALLAVIGGFIFFRDEIVQSGDAGANAMLTLLNAVQAMRRGIAFALNGVLGMIERVIDGFLSVARTINIINEGLGLDTFDIPAREDVIGSLQIDLTASGGDELAREIIRLRTLAGDDFGAGSPASERKGRGPGLLSSEALRGLSAALMDVSRQQKELTDPPTVIPFLPGQAPGQVNNITVNAGLGVNGNRVGQDVVEILERYEREAGPVFEAARQ